MKQQGDEACGKGWVCQHEYVVIQKISLSHSKVFRLKIRSWNEICAQSNKHGEMGGDW